MRQWLQEMGDKVYGGLIASERTDDQATSEAARFYATLLDARVALRVDVTIQSRLIEIAGRRLATKVQERELTVELHRELAAFKENSVFRTLSFGDSGSKDDSNVTQIPWLTGLSSVTPQGELEAA